jgi:guanyl-specific ribonuclease Sa
MSDVKNGSVGKLKLSNEMKEKLEAVTGSRKNSIRSNASSSKRSELEIAPETIEVRKLSENRKLLMEQKLGGGNFSLFKDFFICFQHNVFSQKGTALTILI